MHTVAQIPPARSSTFVRSLEACPRPTSSHRPTLLKLVHLGCDRVVWESVADSGGEGSGGGSPRDLQVRHERLLRLERQAQDETLVQTDEQVQLLARHSVDGSVPSFLVRTPFLMASGYSKKVSSRSPASSRLRATGGSKNHTPLHLPVSLRLRGPEGISPCTLFTTRKSWGAVATDNSPKHPSS